MIGALLWIPAFAGMTGGSAGMAGETFVGMAGVAQEWWGGLCGDGGGDLCGDGGIHGCCSRSP